ncbi:hypothetical protein [Flavobacterium sp.]|jgi:hypothetical protein|uniref:hypothetical protein n=1 Tax=Flavobacterium sp. TaxID=239 RepID=UPI0037BEFEF8
MILKKLLILVLLVPFLFNSCSNDSGIDENSVDTPLNFGNEVSKSFTGQIVDESNIPLANVVITVGNKTANTDRNGVFIINNATVHEKFAFIKARKTGFLDGSRSLVPTNGMNYARITLLSGTIVGTVNSGTSGSVSLGNGSKVTFDGNFKTVTGQPYTGVVSVIMKHLDPSDPSTVDKMPGMLLAANSSGEERVLETFGMMNIELRGAASQKLQLSTTAQIEMPISTSQLASAPATIPLWHFDETLGYWKEEGAATKQGTKYVGTVSHFSWWNCDAQFPTVRLCVTVVNSNGVPLSNVKVGIRRASNSYTVNGFTNSQGQVCGLVPANETLTMVVFDSCENAVSTTSIGPFSADTTLPNLVISNTTIQSTLVQGNLLKCDGTNVTNGYVLMRYGNQNLMGTVTNGAFSFTMLVCSATNTAFSLEGFDYDNLQTTNPINFTFTTPITNVGNITACNSISEFISYRIDSNPVRYIIANITANVGTTSGSNSSGLSINGFNANSSTTNERFYLFGNTNIPGVYSTSMFSIESPETGGINIQTVNAVSFNLSSVGATGQYIDITFNGTYTNSTGSHTINGVAHVIRDN